MFYIGQKVVCVTTINPLTRKYIEIYPKKDEILTIRTIDFDEGSTYLRFTEIVNKENKYFQGMGEIQFESVAFRPIVSQFKKITFEKINELVETSEN